MAIGPAAGGIRSQQDPGRAPRASPGAPSPAPEAHTPRAAPGKRRTAGSDRDRSDGNAEHRQWRKNARLTGVDAPVIKGGDAPFLIPTTPCVPASAQGG